MYKFLLYISYNYGFTIVRPLQEEIRKRGGEVAWFIDVEESKKLIEKDEVLLNSVEEVMKYNPDIILVGGNEVPHFFPGIKVQLFHGFSIGKRDDGRGFFRLRGFFDLYCTHGPSSTIPFLELKKKHGYFDVVETGWSKVDPLFPVKIKSSIKPTILFASTFTPRLSCAHNNDVFEELKRLVKLEKWNWLITLHPKMDKDIVRKYKSLKGNVTYIPYLKNLDPLMQADLLLSDTSSIIAEFIIQKKPVVTIDNRKKGDFLIDITDVSKIEESISMALTKPMELMSEIDQYVSQLHPYDDGESSKRVIDASIDFIESDRSKELKKKPLNLVRKYQIRKRLDYFK